MAQYRMLISYDGFDYQGWQCQPHQLTICDIMQNSFKKVFNEEIALTGASRTDAGVHALGQVATFNSELTIDILALQKAWNASLPPAIYIRSLEKTNEPFNPHKNVAYKTYLYHIFERPSLPFNTRYGWLYPFIHNVDLVKLEKALNLYQGTHDFFSFAKVEEEKSTIRTIYGISLKKIKPLSLFQIKITGNGFLHNQIRRMVGCALNQAQEGRSIEVIKDMLTSPGIYDRMIKAEAHGLTLQKIAYK